MLNSFIGNTTRAQQNRGEKQMCMYLIISVSHVFIHLISHKMCLWFSVFECICLYAWVYECTRVTVCVRVLEGGVYVQGRELVNKSVWGLGVWGWNMVPAMWSNVKNSATPGNNKSPNVASPQNKYTPLYKSSIWTMSRNKDAPNTSPTHMHTHAYTQHPSHTAAMFIYTFISLFLCSIETACGL